MDALHSFEVIRPRTVEEALAARQAHPESRMIGGGTDLLVNMRRRIETPPVLIDTNDLADLKSIEVSENGLVIGASVRLYEVAEHPEILRLYPAVAKAAGSIAGPTHRNMGTVGGNICLDTRCIYYNQSEWWREANDHCLKTELGDMCHVAPKSKGVCFATYSGDLAPAMLLFDGEIDLFGPNGQRTVPMRDFYIGYSRQDGSTGDGIRYMALEPGEFVLRVRAAAPGVLRSGYDKVRIRRSIEYPVAGCAAAVARDGRPARRSAHRDHRHQPAPRVPRRRGGPGRRGAGRRGEPGHRRSVQGPAHVDENHLHPRPLPPPRGDEDGDPAGKAVVRGSGLTGILPIRFRGNGRFQTTRHL